MFLEGVILMACTVPSGRHMKDYLHFAGPRPVLSNISAVAVCMLLIEEMEVTQ